MEVPMSPSRNLNEENKRNIRTKNCPKTAKNGGTGCSRREDFFY